MTLAQQLRRENGGTAMPTKIKPISVAPLIASAIRRIHEGSSVSALFQAPRIQQEMLIPL